MSFSLDAFEAMAEAHFQAEEKAMNGQIQDESGGNSEVLPSPTSLLIHIYQQNFSYVDNTRWPHWNEPQSISKELFVKRDDPKDNSQKVRQSGDMDAMDYESMAGKGPVKKNTKKRRAKKQARQLPLDEPFAKPFIPAKGTSPSIEYVAALVQKSSELAQFLAEGENVLQQESDSEDGEIEISGLDRIMTFVNRGCKLPPDVQTKLAQDEEMKSEIVNGIEDPTWDQDKINSGWKLSDGKWI
ncbi:MAG: hypothetical protein SGCHY_005283 [Lobulomycetales sp.]